MDFKFERKRSDAIPESRMLIELEKAAEHFKFIEFGRRDFDKIAGISSKPIARHFGSWKNALAVLKKHLQAKGLDFRPRSFSSNRIYSDKELFDEMDRIWQKAGQRPSRKDWESSEPKISYITYQRRFGGWINTCLKFIEYKMGGLILSDSEASNNKEEVLGAVESHSSESESNRITPTAAMASFPAHNSPESGLENSRTIPLGLRLKVLDRDNFRCRFCGRSPATEIGVRLHIDHIIPFSKGGKTTFENLQTLCYDCNLGKSDKAFGAGSH